MRFNRYTAWTGPLYPNCTQTWPNATKNGPMFADLKVFGVPLPYGTPATQSKLTWVYDCDAAPGCLFNVETDSTEHTNLAGDPKYANVLAELRSALNASNATLFNPDRGSTTLAACDTAIDQGHFYVRSIRLQCRCVFVVECTYNRWLIHVLGTMRFNRARS